MTVAMLKSVTATHTHSEVICPCRRFCICPHATVSAKFFYYLNHDSLSKQKKNIPTPLGLHLRATEAATVATPSCTTPIPSEETISISSKNHRNSLAVFGILSSSRQLAAIFMFLFCFPACFLFILPKTLPFPLRERR